MTKDTYDDLLSDDQPPKKESSGTLPGTLGGYTLIRELGAGGMGTVYEAEQEALKRRVALKILAPHLSVNTKAIQRFKREGEAAGRQQHPNIVAIHDVGEENGVHYIAQELVPGGRNLRDQIDDLRHRPEVPTNHYDNLANLFIKCASALQHAHDSGVVHRDIKPANIMLTPEGEPMVADFGLALVQDEISLSRTGQFAGTPYYMSPEQAASRRMGIDHRSDIFSLGVTLYEALTFARAFAGDTSQQVIEQILLEDPIDPCKLRSRVPSELSAICLKAIEKKREYRYQTMAEFAADLQRYLGNEPILAKPPGVVRRSVKWIRRHPISTITIVALCVVSALLVQLNTKSAALTKEVETSEFERIRAEAAMWEAKGYSLDKDTPGASLAAARSSLGLAETLERYNRLTTLASKSQSMVLTGHTGIIRDVVITPNAKRLVTGSLDKTARIWDIETGSMLRVLEGHEGAIWSVAVTPDGKRVVTGSADQTARIWDLETGQIQKVLKGHEGTIFATTITPDGERLLTGSADHVVRVWDLNTGLALKELRGHSDEIWNIELTPDGTRLVTSSRDKTVRVWDLKTGQTTMVLSQQKSIVLTTITPDGKRLLIGSQDRTATVWDLETGQVLESLEGYEGINWATGIIMPDGKEIVTGGSRYNSRTMSIWDFETGAILKVVEGHEGTISTAAITPDGKRLVTGSLDNTARIWDIETGKPLQVFNGHAAAITPDGEHLVTGIYEKSVRVWEIKTGTLLKTLTGNGASIYAAAIAPDGKRLVTGSQDKKIRIWDLETGQTLHILEGHQGGITAAAITPDGKQVVTGSFDTTIRIWDIETGTALKVLNGHEGAITAIAITPDNKRLVTGSFDETVRVWDLATGNTLQVLEEHQGSIGAAAITPDGERLITGSHDKTVRVWDLKTGEVLRVLQGHEDTIYAMAITLDGERVVTGSRDRTARVWDIDSGQMLQVFEGHKSVITVVAITPDSQQLVTGSKDQTTRFWDIDPAHHPLRTIPELIEYSGTLTNYRPCQNTHDIIPILPFPAPDTAWAPEDLCDAWTSSER